MHKEQRIIAYEETWPPNQPISYVPQSLMYHQGRYCKEETDLMMELLQMDDDYPLVQYIKSTAKVTKKLTEIFLSPPNFLLIEGFKGMGKTIILKEIAYRWSKNELLTTCKIVFLVRLQDPKIHKLKTWSDFLQYYCEEKGLDSTFVSNYTDYNSGKNIAFLFDAFEEFPTDLRKDGFVHKVLKREVLPSCVLVITSCPHSSACLRPQATIRVCLLGFTEMKQKKKFICKAIQDKQKIKEVTQHLEHDSTLKKFCFSPIHMVFLLHIYQYSHDLFSNVSKLYEHIVCLTICRHLAKHDNSFENTTYNLSNLPDDCDKILIQLSKLAADHPRTKMKIVFTSDNIKETCPDIFRIPGAINGFGLLQAVQCDGLTGRIMKFNFSHPIIPEALAAHHNQIPNSQLKCLRSFKTYSEAGNLEICRRIVNAKVFDKKTINLRGTILSSSDIKCLALILTQSPHKKWEEVDLHGCDIKDDGIVILHEELIKHSITIKRFSLSDNNLTMSSSSQIHEIIIHCAVKVLAIRHNPAIGKDPHFYFSILSHPDSMVEQLYMSNTNCKQSNATTNMFSALEKNKTLKLLQSTNNNITDDDCDAIVRMLQNNTSLVEFNISGNQITAKNAKRIIQALANNNTLEYLALPWYKLKHQKSIAKLAKKVDKNRYRHHCCKLDLFCHQPFTCH